VTPAAPRRPARAPLAATVTSVAAVAAIALAGTGCVQPDALSSTCLDDGGCDAGDVCAFGLCVGPDDARLATMDLDVEPLASTGVPAQTVLGVDARAARGVRVDVALRPATTLRGTASLDDGGGIGGVVTATPAVAIAGRLRLPSTDSSDGTWSLPLVDGAAYRVAVVPVDAAVAPAVTAGDVTAGVDDGVALTSCHLPRGADDATTCPIVVIGRVVAGAGAAARGVAALEVRVVDTVGRRVSTLARTTDDGAFAVGLPAPLAGGALEVRPSADNALQPSLRRPLERVAASLDLGVITQGERANTVAVAGAVVSASGAPASGAQVAMHGLVGAGEFYARGVTDDDGAFTLAVRPGRYMLVAVGAVDGDDGLFTGELVVDAALADLTVTLPPRLDVALTIVDAARDVVAAASVELQRIGDAVGVVERPLSGAQPAFVSATDDEGRAALRVPAGRYRVTIRPPAGVGVPVYSAVLVVEDAVERRLALPDALVLAGAVQDPAGGPTSGAVVRVFSPLVDELGRALYLGEAVTAADGTFTVAVPDLGR